MFEWFTKKQKIAELQDRINQSQFIITQLQNEIYELKTQAQETTSVTDKPRKPRTPSVRNKRTV